MAGTRRNQQCAVRIRCARCSGPLPQRGEQPRVEVFGPSDAELVVQAVGGAQGRVLAQLPQFAVVGVAADAAREADGSTRRGAKATSAEPGASRSSVRRACRKRVGLQRPAQPEQVRIPLPVVVEAPVVKLVEQVEGELQVLAPGVGLQERGRIRGGRPVRRDRPRRRGRRPDLDERPRARSRSWRERSRSPAVWAVSFHRGALLRAPLFSPPVAGVAPRVGAAAAAGAQRDREAVGADHRAVVEHDLHRAFHQHGAAPFQEDAPGLSVRVVRHGRSPALPAPRRRPRVPAPPARPYGSAARAPRARRPAS